MESNSVQGEPAGVMSVRWGRSLRWSADIFTRTSVKRHKREETSPPGGAVSNPELLLSSGGGFGFGLG